jgi:thiol-disulfide isomerase/thioredoxin
MRILLFFYLLGSVAIGNGQVYIKGDKVKDIPIDHVLNQQQVNSLFAFHQDILILDFFGTWCAPCIKALPVLSSLQLARKEKLAVVLVSTEEEKQLQSFIQQRAPFPFPVVVDTKQIFTRIFNPPSYPYTVVLGPNRTILAITEASKITTEQIDEWLAEKKDIAKQNASPGVTSGMVEKDKISVNDAEITNAAVPVIKPVPSNSVLDLSERFIYAAKTGNETNALIQAIASLSFDSLQQSLPDDAAKKAFWINLYNGFTQVRLKKDANQYLHRSAFYGSREMTIAGKKFSLDDIEHGILRHSSIKWSLGYLHKWFPSHTEKSLRVNRVDFRIHFALNCGAKSCPPIASYQADNIDNQLNIATKAYLSGEAEYDSLNNILKLPALMSWFRHDFGGKKKMLALAKDISLIPKDVNPAIQFKKYDWTLYLTNYSH